MKEKGKSKTKFRISVLLALILILLIIVAINPMGMFVLPVTQDRGGVGGTTQYRDIAMWDIYWYPANPVDGQNVAIYGIIKNTGSAKIPAGSRTEITVWYDGAYELTLNYTFLNITLPGQSHNVYLDSEVFAAGSHSVRVALTPYFSDNNSGNNERTETITVTQQQNQTHKACVGIYCQTVNGPGPNTCNTNWDCNQTVPTCTDSDGINYYVKGYVSGIDQNGNPYTTWDSCASSVVLNERYCSGSSPQTQTYTCPITCNDGACVQGNQTGNQTGSLNVTSIPSAASLYVDNIYRGITPKFVSGLSSGSHSVLATKPGYQDYTTSVTIYAGQTTYLNIVMQPNQSGSNYPTVSVTHSGPYNMTNSSATMSITAIATDDVDVNTVRIYADNLLRWTCMPSGINTYYVCTYTGSFAYGTHSYYATATDSDSQTTTSPTGYFTIP